MYRCKQEPASLYRHRRHLCTDHINCVGGAVPITRKFHCPTCRRGCTRNWIRGQDIVRDRIPSSTGRPVTRTATCTDYQAATTGDGIHIETQKTRRSFCSWCSCCPGIAFGSLHPLGSACSRPIAFGSLISFISLRSCRCQRIHRVGNYRKFVSLLPQHNSHRTTASRPEPIAPARSSPLKMGYLLPLAGWK